MQPVGKHAYVKIVPQIPYSILGKKITHASDIRKMYQDGNDNDRNQIIADLYGQVDPELREIFDTALGVNQPQEGIIYGQEKRFAGDAPVSVMRERREQLKSKIAQIREQLAYFRGLKIDQRVLVDYIEERNHRKK